MARKRPLQSTPNGGAKKKQCMDSDHSKAVMLKFINKCREARREENIIVLSDDDALPPPPKRNSDGNLSSLPSPGSLQSLPMDETMLFTPAPTQYDTVEPSDAAVACALAVICYATVNPSKATESEIGSCLSLSGTQLPASIPVIVIYERTHITVAAALCACTVALVTKPVPTVVDAAPPALEVINKECTSVVELEVVERDVGRVRTEKGNGRLMVCAARGRHDGLRFLVVLCGGWGVGGHTECEDGTPINIVAHQCSIPTQVITDPGTPHCGKRAIVLADKEPVVLIQHPSILISATEVSDAMQCTRRPYVAKKSRASRTPLSLPALSGTIVHGVVQDCIGRASADDSLIRSLIKKHISEVAVALHASQQNDESSFALIEPFIPAIKHCVMALKGSCTEDTSCRQGRRINAAQLVEAEKKVACAYHGLKGVVDAQVVVDIEDMVKKPVALEIKTLQHLPQRGRTVLKTHHKAQLLVYLLLLSMDGQPVTEGILTYLAKGCSHARLVSVERSGLWLETAHIVRIRNTLAVHLRNKDMPPPEFNVRMCKHCSHSEACLALASISNERAPSKILEFLEATQPGMVKEDTGPEIVRRESTMSEVADSQNSAASLTDSLERKLTESSWSALGRSDEEQAYLRQWDRWIALEEATQPPNESTMLLAKQRGNVVSLYSQVKYSRLRGLIVGLAPPVFKEDNRQLDIPGGLFLNDTQNEAVRRALNCEDYSIIQGLPGTGKTTTIAALVGIMAGMGKSVLVVAGTNSAVDTICLKLKDVGVRFARVVADGREAVVHPDLAGDVFPSAFACVGDVRNALLGLGVVATTAHNLHHQVVVGHGVFDHVVVDEAGQMLQPVCLGGLLCGRRFTLVGDHEQLPPIVRSEEAEKEGAAVSLLERLALAQPEAVTTLTLQYRMNNEIAVIPNLVMYNGRLKVGCDAVASWRLKTAGNVEATLPEWLRVSVMDDPPLVFIDCSDVSERNPEAHNVSVAEARMAVDIATRLVPCGSVGIISPFRPQVEQVKTYLGPSSPIEVLTIDQAQGKDIDAVVITLAKCSGDKIGPLIRSPNRLNVAFTRARKKQVCIGSFAAVFDALQEWEPILAYARSKGIMVRPSSVY